MKQVEVTERCQYETVWKCAVHNIANVCNDMHERGYDVHSVVFDSVTYSYTIVGKVKEYDGPSSFGPGKP